LGLSALAVSIRGLACAAYLCTPPRNPLVSLPGQKSLVSELKTNSFTSGDSGWKLRTGKVRIISHNYRKIRQSRSDTGSTQLQPDDINKLLTQVAGGFADLLINWLHPSGSKPELETAGFSIRIFRIDTSCFEFLMLSQIL
jgi:hypothetical protein